MAALFCLLALLTVALAQSGEAVAESQRVFALATALGRGFEALANALAAENGFAVNLSTAVVLPTLRAQDWVEIAPEQFQRVVSNKTYDAVVTVLSEAEVSVVVSSRADPPQSVTVRIFRGPEPENPSFLVVVKT